LLGSWQPRKHFARQCASEQEIESELALSTSREVSRSAHKSWAHINRWPTKRIASAYCKTQEKTPFAAKFEHVAIILHPRAGGRVSADFVNSTHTRRANVAEHEGAAIFCHAISYRKPVDVNLYAGTRKDAHTHTHLTLLRANAAQM